VIDEVKGVIEGVRVTLQDFNQSSINDSIYCYVLRGETVLGSHSSQFMAYYCKVAKIEESVINKTMHRYTKKATNKAH
jgi:hypothetical protein